MKSYAIPDMLLAAAANLIKRLPAADDVRAVLNGLETCVGQQDRDAQSHQGLGMSTMGGGGPGSEEPAPKKPQ